MYIHTFVGDADIQFLQEVAGTFPTFAVHTYIHSVPSIPPHLKAAARRALVRVGGEAHRAAVRGVPGEQHGHRAGPELAHPAQEGCVGREWTGHFCPLYPTESPLHSLVLFITLS